MKKPKHELMTFVAGIVMLVAGLFILSQKVIVYSSFFSSFGGLSIWGTRISSGMVVIPLIIGIVWMFMTDSFASKVFFCTGGTADCDCGYFVNEYSSYQHDNV